MKVMRGGLKFGVEAEEAVGGLRCHGKKRFKSLIMFMP
jgi:hypothetical protein